MSHEHVTDEELSEIERLRPSIETWLPDGEAYDAIMRRIGPVLASELRRYRRPVDVNATMQACCRDIQNDGFSPIAAATVCTYVRPHVEHAARLQRENEELRAERDAAECLSKEGGEHYMARLRISNECVGLRAELATARVEVESLRIEAEAARGAELEWKDDATALAADVERLTRERDNLSERLAAAGGREERLLARAVGAENELVVSRSLLSRLLTESPSERGMRAAQVEIRALLKEPAR